MIPTISPYSPEGELIIWVVVTAAGAAPFVVTFAAGWLACRLFTVR